MYDYEEGEKKSYFIRLKKIRTRASIAGQFSAIQTIFTYTIAIEMEGSLKDVVEERVLLCVKREERGRRVVFPAFCLAVVKYVDENKKTHTT